MSNLEERNGKEGLQIVTFLVIENPSKTPKLCNTSKILVGMEMSFVECAQEKLQFM